MRNLKWTTKTVLSALVAVFLAVCFIPTFSVQKTASADQEVKYVENHTIGKHVITIVDETTDLDRPLTPSTTETYNPSDRTWGGISSVIAAGNNVFVAWRTGGMREPSPYVYVVVALSTDGGRTFREPYLIIDPPEEDGFVDIPMFYYNHAGDLWLTYRIFGCNRSAEWAVKIVNPDGLAENIKFEEPIQIGNPNNDPMGCFVPFVKPLLMDDGRILFGSSNYANKQSTAIFESLDDGKSFRGISQIDSEAGGSKTNGESSIVKLKDGSLWCLSRVEGGALGGIEESFSYDGGRTWTTAKGNLSDPLIGPGSRFTMINIKDGDEDALLFITNYSTGIRGNMTAFLSYDDGLTWPYSITLDPHISAYPDAYQAPDGKIYIVYDKGRYTEGGVRLCVLTVEDLKAGDFVSEDCINRLAVTKTDPEWGDIVSVNGAFEREMTVKNGTKLSKLTATLPTTFTVTDSNGKTVEITGTWSSNNYRAKDAGVYEIKFQSILPGKLVDTFEVLTIKVTVKDGGCQGSIDGGIWVLLPISLAVLAIVIKERKYELK